jgi:TfoX/Sxy family transcriptional regulator of competence genes
VSADENLTKRVRRCIGKRSGVSEKNMFGCVGFFLNGNLACGVHEKELIVRLGANSAEAALQEPRTRPFDLSGRLMKGWLLVDIEDDPALASWVERGLTHAASLPRK